MQGVFRHVYTILAFLFFLSFSSNLWAGESHRVLFISSYHPAFPTFFQQVEGIRSVLDKQSTLLDIEFMDSKRFPDRVNLDNFHHTLSDKLSRIAPYDAVIVGDDNALSFTLKYQHELFPKQPIVFLGVNNLSLAREQNSNPLVTGVVEAVSMEETLKLMIRLQPQTKRIMALVDGTPSGQGDLKTFYQYRQELNPVVLSEISLAKLSFAEFANQLKSLGREDAVLLLSAYQDKNNKIFQFDESLKLIIENLSIPLYHLWYHGVGNGVFGGKVISHFAQGKVAAEIVSKILGGTAVKEIPVREDSPNRYLFDYRQLLQFGIDTNDLPEGSIILNEPHSVYHENKGLIWSAVWVFFGYTLLAFGMYRNIRNLKKTKNALKESEAGFRTLVDQAADAMFVHDLEGRLLDVNRCAVKNLGYTREELLTMNVMDVDLDLANQENGTSFWHQLVPGRPVVFEARHRRKDGTFSPVEVNLGRLTFRGEPVMLAMVRDISERKLAEKTLRDSEARFRSIFENAAASMGMVGPDGFILQINPAACLFFGYTETEFLNLKVEDLTHPLDLEKTRTMYNEIKSGKRRVVDYEKRYLRKDGTTVWGHTTLAPVYDSDQNLSYAIVLAQDITPRIKAEQSLKEALVDAEEARDKIEVILKSIGDGLIVADLNNRVVLMNLLAEKLAGVSLNEAISRPIQTLFAHREFYDQVASVLAGKEGASEVEWVIMNHHFAQPRSIQAHTALVQGQGGRITGTVTLLRDVTRERELDRMKNEFISTAAHELRTPLAVVMGFAEILLNQEEYGVNDPALQKEYLSTIYEKSKRLEGIIEDLLDLSRIQAGLLISLTKAPFDICQLLEQVAAEFQQRTDNHTLELTLPEELVELSADRNKLEQVLENLISNAVKFSPPGSVIKVVGRVTEDCFQLSVTDEGIGMTPEQVKQVFDKFYRVDASSTAPEGLGLGLSIVKHIIEAHGGEILIESEYGKGTTVTFTLPLWAGK